MEPEELENELFTLVRPKKQMNMRFSSTLLRSMRELADRNHRSLNAEFAVAAERYITLEKLDAETGLAE